MRNWLGYEKAFVLIVLALALFAAAVLWRWAKTSEGPTIQIMLDRAHRVPWRA
jgi:hypothetical protein